MQTNFLSAIKQIAEEKNIPQDVILETVEAALAAAYKKDYGEKDQEVRTKIDEETGEIRVFVSREVAEEVENPNLQISLEEAKKIQKEAKVGDMVEREEFPKDFGRIAAQTAKQIIIQRIREAERDIVFSEYKDKEGELVNATVQRIEGNTVIVDLGQASGVLFGNEQVDGERYYIGQRIKVYIVKVEQSTRGPQVVVSRSHPGVVKRLFEMEVPEIEAGIVQVKAIAREAGHRTKIAVDSTDENVDPVGSCVGQRGIRVQSVLAELGEEKIDVILYKEDPKEFITNALSPAKVVEIELNEEEKKAKVLVPEDQLSLAIGKSGQNVRLAAKLTGWNIDIEVKEDASGVHAAEEALKDMGEGKEETKEELVGENNEVAVLDEEPEVKGEPIDEEAPVEESIETEAAAEEKKETETVEDQEKPAEETLVPTEEAKKESGSEEENEVKEIEGILEKENIEPSVEETKKEEATPEEEPQPEVGQEDSAQPKPTEESKTNQEVTPEGTEETEETEPQAGEKELINDILENEDKNA